MPEEKSDEEKKKKEKNKVKLYFSYEMIKDRLQFKPEFLNIHEKIIDDRFESAGTEILKGLESRLENADISGINKCLQLASTILLLGTESDVINKELESVFKQNEKLKIEDIDPSTILTVAVLYYLVKLKEEEYEKKNDKEKQKAIKAIHARFTKIKWLVGGVWMKKLKIK
jgi:hypothetical protein